MKLEKKKIMALYLMIFVAIAGGLFLLHYTQETIAGARIDWISQHTAIADFFRKRFYETNNLFPQFALELGGGQNIFNFAYYGLYNPLYLLSFLFPFISMEDWFQMVGLVTHILDGILCFIWLKKNSGEKESAAGALMLMLSTTVVYHNFVQVMFVNYLPFFLLMLIGTDIRKETGKGMTLTVGTVCMILSSFYFAPACMVALGIWIFTGIEKKGQNFCIFCKLLIWNLFPALLGILLSMFYLIPVFYALLSGRNGRNKILLGELFFPDINVEKYLYNPYGLGLTAMAIIIVFIWLFAEKCREKNIAILLVLIFMLQVFPWILNGGLYVRSKVFAPFLPLISFLGAKFFKQIEIYKVNEIPAQNISRKSIAAGYAMGTVILLLGSRGISKGEILLIYADILLCGVGMLFTISRRKQNLVQSFNHNRWSFISVVTVGTMFIASVSVVYNTSNLRVTKQQLIEVNNLKVKNAVEFVLSNEKQETRMEIRGNNEYKKANQNRILVSGQNITTCYSSFENPSYIKFRDSIGLTRATRNRLMQDAQDNPLFLRFMGVKYLIGGNGLSGWEKIYGSGADTVYRNNRVAPLFYLTNQTASEKLFEQLSWQEKQIFLLEAAAVPKDSQKSGTPILKKMAKRKILIKEVKNENGAVTKNGNNIRIKSKKAITTMFTLERESKREEYIFLSFSVKNRQLGKDVSVTVNGVKNKLSKLSMEYYNGNEIFHYTFALPEGTNKLSVCFGAGDYEICKPDCYVSQVDEIKNKALYKNSVNMKRLTSGDGYEGVIQNKEKQWLITSIPYDENMTISVDGKCVKTVQVNGGFVGAEIPGGIHKIKMHYQAPGSRYGFGLSVSTFIIVIIWKIKEMIKLAKRRKIAIRL